MSLRKASKVAGITQADLAARLDVTQTFVSKCERGERRLDVKELRSWCMAIGVSNSSNRCGREPGSVS
ncbi:helix-turn-helix domain-containing protein [Cupriavidus basilensis]